jgi:hypothetical protein
MQGLRREKLPTQWLRREPHTLLQPSSFGAHAFTLWQNWTVQRSVGAGTACPQGLPHAYTS